MIKTPSPLMFAIVIILALIMLGVIFGIVEVRGDSPARKAYVTAYCNGCDPSGITRSGKKFSKINYSFCAADPRYWKPGTVLHFGAPINANCTIEDTGGVVKGRDRFDFYKRGSCKQKSGCYGWKNPKIPYTVVKRGTRNW